MEYEKMLFYANTQTKMSQNNCLASPVSSSTTVFKVAPNCLQLPDPFADNFDLSLLPQECTSSAENIPTIVYQYTNAASSSAPTTPSATASTSTLNLTPTTPPQIKIEQTWPCTTENIKQEQNFALHFDALNCQQLQLQQQQQQQQTKCSSYQLIPPLAYRQTYPSPQSSPTQSEYSFASTGGFTSCYDSLSSSRSSLFPSSPCPSLDAGSIKQELLILPPSPPESNCEAPSPHSSCADIKSEPLDADVETLIDLNSLFEKTFNVQKSSPSPSALSVNKQQQLQQSQHQQQQQQQQDHQLLREYLEDNSFQKKHSLKPLALDSFIGGLAEEVRGEFEPVISLALEHAKREADETCAKLHISQDPSCWSPVQVHAWLRSTIAQFKLPPIDDIETKFCEDGAALILLSEEEFMRRTPESGSTLHAQLEVWKMAYSDNYQSGGVDNNGNCNGSVVVNGNMNALTQSSGTATGDIGVLVAGAMQMQQGGGLWQTECLPNLNMEADEDSDDEDDVVPSTSVGMMPIVNAATVVGNTTPTNGTPTNGVEPKRTSPGRNGGAHIHLWQFLKELLSAPHVNGMAIRWMDRNKGIFKIEDSVRVAKLWGRRKNRPAMNYDKLSRSIRQYYKKGIMKKTERSQRLVYQFCHPYHL